jgi:hypothetical protein
VAGGCANDDLVRPAVEATVDELDTPAGHFADEVAAGAFAESILKCGGSAIAVPGDVVNVADRRITIGIPAGLITQLDQFGQQPSKRRRAGSPPTIGPELWVLEGPVKSRRYHLRPRLVVRISQASSCGSGP